MAAREAKLPQWAKDQLANARRAADLSWPKEARPEPYCTADANGHIKGENPRGLTLYIVVGGFDGRAVEARNIDRNGYVSSPSGGFASRMSGRFYSTKRDALLAALWDEANDAAHRLHRIAQELRAASP